MRDRFPVLYSHTLLVILFGRVDMKQREGIRKKWWNSKEVGEPEIFRHQVLVSGWRIKVNLFAKDGDRSQVKSDSASEEKKWKPTWKPTLFVHFLSARDSSRQITHFLTWPVCFLDISTRLYWILFYGWRNWGSERLFTWVWFQWLTA